MPRCSAAGYFIPIHSFKSIMSKKSIRTILITFSAHTVLRNLFLFSGGFFDQLKKVQIEDKNLRIVFLLRARDRVKYHEMLRTAPHAQTFIRCEDIPSKRTMLQKIFRFFYAYLVFTDTTRILTTIGMRVEEPPAASNVLLTPLRLIIAKTFGRMDFVKKKVVPYLFGYVFYKRPFEKIFNEFNPDLVFVTHIYGDYDAYVLSEAKRRVIKTVGMPSGWDHIDKYFLPFQVDKLFVPSEQVASHAENFQGYERKNLEVTGYTQFDYFVDPKFHLPREKMLRMFNLPPDAKYILYVSGSAYCPDEPDVIEKALEWINDGAFGRDVYLILRPYLGSRSKDKAFDEQKFSRLIKNPRVVYYDKKSWDSAEDSEIFINLMKHASVVMCVYSTVFLEAAVYDRPLVAAKFDGYHIRAYRRSIRRFSDFEHFKEVLQVGAIKEAHTFDELKKAITDYIKNPSLDGEKREIMRKTVCSFLDGQAAKRLLDGMLKEVPVYCLASERSEDVSSFSLQNERR